MLRQLFSTTTVEPSRRLAYWNEIAAGAFGPVSVDGAGDGFDGELVRVGGGSLRSYFGKVDRLRCQ